MPANRRLENGAPVSVGPDATVALPQPLETAIAGAPIATAAISAPATARSRRRRAASARARSS
jgi:hypothetical protein